MSCSAGYAFIAGVCTLCLSGTYSPGSSAAVCVQAPIGKLTVAAKN